MTIYADRFPLCLPDVLAQECPFPNDWSNLRNFSNDAHDPGGATMCGITQKEYDRYRQSQGLPFISVRHITEVEGQFIYKESYWMPKCPALAPGLDLCYFDTCVNCGQFGAAKILQAALGVEVDGIWGPITQAAVNKITNVRGFIGVFGICRKNYYRHLGNFKYFGTGWINRTNAITALSVAMAPAPAPTALATAGPPSDVTIGTNAAIPVAIMDARSQIPEMFWGFITYERVSPLVADIVKAALDAVNAAHESPPAPTPPTQEQLS